MYKLNVQRDVDPDGDLGFILNLPRGFRFEDTPEECPDHVRGYDTMRELRESAKLDVTPCKCKECLNGLANSGGNDSEYQIYVAAATDLGWKVKSYDEWLNS